MGQHVDLVIVNSILNLGGIVHPPVGSFVAWGSSSDAGGRVLSCSDEEDDDGHRLLIVLVDTYNFHSCEHSVQKVGIRTNGIREVIYVPKGCPPIEAWCDVSA